MKNTDKRAFIMNDCNSPYILQAIFILRDGVCAEQCGVLADAERIVASYMKHTPQNMVIPPKKKSRIPMILSIIGTLVFVVALCIGFLLQK